MEILQFQTGKSKIKIKGLACFYWGSSSLPIDDLPPMKSSLLIRLQPYQSRASPLWSHLTLITSIKTLSLCDINAITWGSNIWMWGGDTHSVYNMKSDQNDCWSLFLKPAAGKGQVCVGSTGNTQLQKPKESRHLVLGFIWWGWSQVPNLTLLQRQHYESR